MKYISISKIAVDDFVAIIDKLSIYEKISKRKNNWLELIMSGDLICPATNKEVFYCSYDKLVVKNITTYHFNFYSEDDILFTIDHKIPLSKGGSNFDISNIQPMICFDNWNKKSKLIYL